MVLSLQLPFAIVPLVMFTANKHKMGVFVAPRWQTIAASAASLLIIALNIKLVVDFLTGA